MEHDRFTEWLHLSIFDDLDGDEKKLLEAHIQSCDECRREREGLIRMLASIDKSSAETPSEGELVNARHHLAAALRNESRAGAASKERALGTPVLARWFGAGRKEPGSTARAGWFRGYGLGFAGAAALCVGFLAGYLAFGTTQPVTQPQRPLPAVNEPYTTVSNVHFVDGDGADGEIELMYDQVRPMRLKAGMDDRRMRRLLAHAILTGDNPGVRLKAISAFETSESPAPADEVKQAFLDALISDPNDGVRRQALLVLQQLPYDEKLKDALMFVLAHDDNPGLRIAAMNHLTAFAVNGEISEKEYYDILDTR